MDGSVIVLTILNLMAGIIFAGFAFVFFLLPTRIMFGLIFDSSGGASLYMFPVVATLGLGVLAYTSYAPPFADWGVRAAILFLPPIACAWLSALPFTRLYDQPARAGQSVWVMSASASLTLVGTFPAGLTFISLQGQDLTQLVHLPLI